MKYVPANEDEKNFLEKYKTKNYDRPSVTSDVAALRVRECQNGEREYSILLIKRGGYPYLDCWALPGGFLQRGETMEECALRELQEETSLKPKGLFPLGCFSSPDRDPRGWIISNAYLAILSETSTVQAGDDARAAQWFQMRWNLENSILTMNLTSSNIQIRAKVLVTPRAFGQFSFESLPLKAPNSSLLAFDHAEILAAVIHSPLLQR